MKRITSLFLTFIMLISPLWCNPEAVKAAEQDALYTETQEVSDMQIDEAESEYDDAETDDETEIEYDEAETDDETEIEYDEAETEYVETEINPAAIDDATIENPVADADTLNDFEIEEIQEAYVDPLFADIIPETEADAVLERAKYEYENPISLYSISSPMAYDEAMDYVRAGMIARAPSINVQFKVATGTQINLSKCMDEIYDDYSSSVSGDYLHFHTFACGYTGKTYTYDDGTVYDLIFAFTYWTTAEQEDELTDSLNETMKDLDLESLNEYEKTKKIYDYITDNVVYDYDAYDAALEYGKSKDRQILEPYMTAWSAYGALNNKTCVCQGYANLFYRMTFEAGVPSKIIAGTGNGGAHAWNIVSLDGQYYNVDSTWDAGYTTYRYFLKSQNNFGNHVRNAEYNTAEFTTAYPMASSNFDVQAYNEALAAASAPNFTNVVVCAYFQDDTAGKAFFETEQGAFTANKKNAFSIWDMYNGTSPRSATNYLDTISYGKLRVNNVLVQYSGDGDTAAIVPIELPYTMSQAYNGDIDGQIIRHVLGKLNTTNVLDNVNLDLDNNGVVDNLTIILKGRDENAKTGTTMVNHKSNFGDPSIKLNGKSISTYNILSTYNMNSGVICHEFLHSIGFADLYNSTDTVGPVSVWDIMASANPGMSWPLAYTRMYHKGWVDIDTITESTSLTLDLQSKKGGNAAYILKSPMNDQEVFVVEFRKKNYEVDLDRNIGSSGVIVYRVDTTNKALSNYYGKTAIYVFRPNTGTGHEQTDLYYAALSTENKRTSIGSSDLDAGLADGALTFSDGSNSGIVISNVSSAAGNQMTLDVKIPTKEEAAAWEDLNIPDDGSSNSKYIDINIYNNVPVVVTQDGRKLNTYQYYNNVWTKIAAEVTLPAMISKVQLANYNGTMYLAYGDFSKAYILRYDASGKRWVSECTINDCNGDFDFQALDDGMRIAYIDASYSCHLGKYTSGSYIDEGVCYSGLCGQPRVVKDKYGIYVAVRAADGTLHLYKQTGTGFSKIKSMPAAVYDIAIYNDKLYVVARPDSISNPAGKYSVSTYDGSNWSTVSTSIGGYETNLIVAGGNLYLLTSAEASEGRTKLYKYDVDNGIFVKEGADVDSTAQNQSMIAIGNSIYVAMVRQTDSRFIVRVKQVAQGGENEKPIVKIPVQSITLSRQTITFDWGAVGTEALTATVAPANAANKALIWSSDNPSVAVVNWHGVVTPVAAGTATISCEAADGSGVKALCRVTVADRTDVERFVIRLYDKCLDRLPDAVGISTWTNILYRKTGTGASVAKGFVYSPEYKNKNTSNEAYVEMLYRVFLDREADADGKAFWVDLLNQGMSRDYVFRGFVESPEYTGICQSYGIERGTVTLTQARDKNINMTKFVNRLYVYVLERRGEEDGLNDWCTALQAKKMTPEQVGEFFVLSPEFKQKNLSDEEYVKILYRTFLGREYDDEGMNTWLTLLRSGTSRETVLRGFTRSPEFKKIIKSFGL
ncbi:MAG: DUF4214 domain-containing protein [Clostridium sp.]|nr:DUF4214 domain-containing protein [Clostridium sp.]